MSSTKTPAQIKANYVALMNAAKDRQSATRRTITRTGNIGFARRPQYLFSGLSKCGICGA